MFERHDLVILCERDHRDVTQYDLILDVMRDPYFVENVGTVFTEVGVQTLNPALNTFLKDDNLSAAEVEQRAIEFQRNALICVMWEKTNFMYFIKGIHEINRGLPADKKPEMYPDRPDRSVEEYKQYFNTLRKGKLHNLDQLEAAISQWIE